MMSNEDLKSAIAQELTEKFGADSHGSPWYNIVATFDDYVIAQGPDSWLYQIPFSLAGEEGEGEAGGVQLGEPRQVEAAYVPVSQAARFVAEAGAPSDEWAFPVQVMEAGWATGTVGEAPGPVPHYFPAAVVAQVAEAVNGARFGRRHPESGDGAGQPERIAGWLDGGRMSGNAALGTVHLLTSEGGLQAKLAAARAARKLDLFGVSVLGYFAFQPGRIEGRECLVAGKLGKLMSVDLCTEAGAGGRFLHYAASHSVGPAVRSEIAALQRNERKPLKPSPPPGGDPSGGPPGRPNQGAIMKDGATMKDGTIVKDAVTIQEGEAMKDRILKALEALRPHDGALATQLSTQLEGAAAGRYPELLLRAAEALASTMQQRISVDSAALVHQAQAALEEAKRLQSDNLVETRLSAARLPAPAAQLVREHLKGQVAAAPAIDGEIQRVREAFAAFAGVGQVGGARVGLETVDKVQLAMDAMLGVKEARKDANVQAFRGLKDAYTFITGDRDMRFGRDGQGGFTRVSEAVATADFPNILLNSMTKKLIQDYADLGMNGLDLLITPASLSDYKQQDRVREGYFGDLPVVGEAAPYAELAKPTDERISYTPAKRGGLLTISEETIRNDDLGAIARFPTHLARAGRHTLKSYITNNFFVNNPNYGPDGITWFNAAHNNMLPNAFGLDALINAEIALMKQQEKDSGNRLGFRIQWIMVPVELAAQAWQLNNSQAFNTGPQVNTANPFYQRFGPAGPNGETPKGIIVNELLTAPHNWYYGVWPANVPFLEIGYLDGLEQPQIFLANLPTQGAQFANDQIQYKTKFVFGGAVTDFRPVGMSATP